MARLSSDELAITMHDFNVIHNKLNGLELRARAGGDDGRLADGVIGKIDIKVREIYSRHSIEFEWKYDEKKKEWRRETVRPFDLARELF